MKGAALTMIVPMVILVSIAMAADAVDSTEIRGQVAGGNFVWNVQNFAGFYYDIKDDLGTETLRTILADKNLGGNSPYGVKYVTSAQSKEFKFEDWGAFKVMGFLAERYFAGYVENVDNVDKNLLFKESDDENSLYSEQLQKILIDDDTEMTVTSDIPLKLEEGYELAIKSIDIDGNKVYLELSKDGSVVDSKVVSPSKENATMANKTYCYKNPAVGDQKNLITIAAHFKNAFRGADRNLATIDGLWQISGEATDVKADTQYDRMTITAVDANAGTITLENKDNAITLTKNKDTVLMSGIRIKTADNDTLRYYVYKKITEPGTYELRGAVATADATWNPQNFAGFYYDIKDDIGTEALSTTLTDKNLSGDPPYGVKYVTTAKSKEFKFEDWGAFKVIGFLAERYFAGYVENVDNSEKNLLFKESTDEYSLSNEQLERILVDDDTEMTVTSDIPLKLEEGYELAIKSIDIDGNKLSLELSKDGSVVDSKVISPSKTDANMADKTYYYVNPAVSAQKNLVTIAAHFKNAFRGADQNLATIDGLWQISGEATEVKVDTQYDKMTITSADANAGTITMENKDNAITLSKNKDVSLMSGIGIKTADNETLRYYIYKAVTIEGATASVIEAAPAVESYAMENVTLASTYEMTATKSVADAKAVEMTATKSVADAKAVEMTATKSVADAKAVEMTATENVADAKTAEKTATENVAKAKTAEKTATENIAKAKTAEKTAMENVAKAKTAEKTATENVADAKTAEKTATENVAKAKTAEKTATENIAKAKTAEKTASENVEEAKAVENKAVEASVHSKAKEGKLLFNPPTQMEQYQDYLVTASIAKENTTELIECFEGPGKIQNKTIEIAPGLKYAAYLEGKDFDISRVKGKESQTWGAYNRPLVWQWNVKPNVPGDHKLLTLNVYINDTEPYDMVNWPVYVEVASIGQKIKNTPKDDWKWLAGLIVTILVLLFGSGVYNSWKSKKKN